MSRKNLIDCSSARGSTRTNTTFTQRMHHLFRPQQPQMSITMPRALDQYLMYLCVCVCVGRGVVVVGVSTERLCLASVLRGEKRATWRGAVARGWLLGCLSSDGEHFFFRQRRERTGPVCPQRKTLSLSLSLFLFLFRSLSHALSLSLPHSPHPSEKSNHS